MYQLLKPLLFRLDPERAHGLSLRALEVAGATGLTRSLVGAVFGAPALPVTVFGLTFPNPVGLAAGYDKDGRGWRGLSCLGFGHVEVGTVTPRPQLGNPKPRIFRLPEDSSLINRLGFPGEGADTVAKRLGSERPNGVVLGINLGKNKDTPLEEAADDYTELVSRFAGLGDYLVVNVSSPNTEGLRSLQARQALTDLLGEVVRARDAQVEILERAVPLLVKLSPDLDDAQLDDALDVVTDLGIDGVIATNTTIGREGLQSRHASEKGGLSGTAVRDKSTALIRAIAKRTGGKLPIIGVGGIFGPDDAKQKLDAGASLVQVYTGLVYQGPALAKRIVKGLIRAGVL